LASTSICTEAHPHEHYLRHNTRALRSAVQEDRPRNSVHVRIVTGTTLHPHGRFRRCLIVDGVQEDFRRWCPHGGPKMSQKTSSRADPSRECLQRGGWVPLQIPCPRNGIYQPAQNHQRGVFSAEPSLPSSVPLQIPCPWDGIRAEPSLDPPCSDSLLRLSRA
jgi:hypothetical protein